MKKIEKKKGVRSLTPQIAMKIIRAASQLLITEGRPSL